VLLMFALLVSMLLGVLGLLYSVGFVLTQRRALQTAADAASLAGAWQVLLDLESGNRSDAAVLAAVLDFTDRNGVPNDGTPGNSTYVSASYVDASGAALAPPAAVGIGGLFPAAAGGVRVTVRKPVSLVLTGFVGMSSIQVETQAAASAMPAAPPTSATLVVPVAVYVDDFQTAFANQSLYDLFDPPTQPLGGPAALDYTSPANAPAPGATDYGSNNANLQYWSDGQHENGTLQQGATVALAGGAYRAQIAAGLLDNIRRQQLTDAGGASYALVMVPLWDTASASPDTVHVVGFATLRLRESDVNTTSASGTFVPYPAAAWGAASSPSPDLGARVIRLAP
jgi:hypothetical protein